MSEDCAGADAIVLRLVEGLDIDAQAGGGGADVGVNVVGDGSAVRGGANNEDI